MQKQVAENNPIQLDDMNDVLADVRAGKPILLVDDRDRENEADLMVAAETVTAAHINFMLQHAKGLICLALEEERLTKLRIPLQVVENTSVLGTNFAVSIDHVRVRDRGVTAEGRARTIRETVSPSAEAVDFIQPGHVFPLAAVKGGVFKRRGQTEGSVDLARLAGLVPAGVICEVMDDKGRMIRGPELLAYRERFDLRVTSIDAIAQYRLRNEVCIRPVVEGVLSNLDDAEILRDAKVLPIGDQTPNFDHTWRAIVYVDDVDLLEHLVLVKGEPRDGTLVRVHSECLTGDVFESKRCDCGFQLQTALATMNCAGEGIIIYLYQEGRGIGLVNKLRAYELQEQGLDTVDANIRLGFAPDLRDYRMAAKILSDLKLKRVKLLTNNPAKVEALRDFGVDVQERIPLTAESDEYNSGYLNTKRSRLGHLIGVS